MLISFIYLQLLRGFSALSCPRFGQLLLLNFQSDYYKQLEEQYEVLVPKYAQLLTLGIYVGYW